jgi:hypothetical protein
MEAKEILERVKALFTELAAPPAPPMPPAPEATTTEYELKDGGKVSIDKVEVGGIVMIDGNPALPGDLELADGTKLTVADNGAITAVTLGTGQEPTEPIAEPAGEDMGAKFTAFETLTSEKFASYEAKFAAYETKFQEYEAKLATYNDMITQLLQFGKLMVEAPAAQPDPAAKQANAFKEEGNKDYSILFN